MGAGERGGTRDCGFYPAHFPDPWGLSEPISLLLDDGKSELRTDHFMVAVGLRTSQIPGFKSQFVFDRYGLDHDTSLFLRLESGICKDQS